MLTPTAVHQEHYQPSYMFPVKIQHKHLLPTTNVPSVMKHLALGYHMLHAFSSIYPQVFYSFNWSNSKEIEGLQNIFTMPYTCNFLVFVLEHQGHLSKQIMFPHEMHPHSSIID